MSPSDKNWQFNKAPLGLIKLEQTMLEKPKETTLKSPYTQFNRTMPQPKSPDELKSTRWKNF